MKINKYLYFNFTEKVSKALNLDYDLTLVNCLPFTVAEYKIGT